MHARLKAFSHALAGISTFFKETVHARIHAIAAVFVVLGGFYFQVSNQEWQMLLVCVTLVFSTEAINSAIEYMVDLVSPEHHILAKKAKDVSAGAVLLVAIFSVIIAFIIFYPKIEQLWL